MHLGCMILFLFLASFDVASQSLPKLTPRQLAVNQLVNASRILASQGVADDCAGHISIRDPLSSDTFLITGGSRTPAQVTPADVTVARINDSQVISAALEDHEPPIRPAEIFIHSSIYQRFPNSTVNSIAYYQAEQLLPWSLFSSDSAGINTSLVTTDDLTGFFATTSGASFLGPHPAPVFSIFDDDPDAATIAVDDVAKGFSLATRFGPADATVASVNETDGFRPLVLMRNDGATVVGTTVPEVTFRFVQAVKSARIQHHASMLSAQNGSVPRFVPAQAIKSSDEYLRSWLLWISQVENAMAADVARSPELWAGSGNAAGTGAGSENAASMKGPLSKGLALIVICTTISLASLLSL
ncbi:uncharacterized protein PAN0_032c6248 [Moesziomyces antarcticus]|uniref:Uncharacterized protein n=2 Tax=Pseudozyma antarctica TaxID=84753 RepID=A0A081CMX2_PSEA2|nr:uncharacterized protein PAN0_032c6248 [Moesziomyces antarcticus]GAK68018.1 conserved hypothetical protein [Moesziomyces antarcticus]SPO49235.1 uncharacterized protein PSANT_06926 [Moesziomyces antarcticus]